MNGNRHAHILSPGQCRAARGLLNWTQAELAEKSGVSRSTVRDFEGERHELHGVTEAKIIEAIEGAGVQLLAPEADGQSIFGPGVRLRCHR